jgi:hypothetical protein
MKGLVFAAMLAAASLAQAQAVVGSAIADGRKMQRFEDGTWRFETAGDMSCVRREFCGGDTWQTAMNSNPDAIAAYRDDDRHYARDIIESVGLRDGLVLENIRAALMDGVSNLIGQAVTIAETMPAKVGGFKGETIVYLVPCMGVDNVFASAIVLGEDFLLPAQTWQLGSSPYTGRHRGLHADFLEATRIPADE